MTKRNSRTSKSKSKQQPLDELGRSIRKRISWFYKIHFALLFPISLLLFYFLVLTSISPKSIPFVTAKIESSLREKFGDDIGLQASYVSFTRYGTMKITVNTLTILYAVENVAKKQALVIPHLESEFSLFDLLRQRFQPSKVKIINPTIIISDLKQINSADSSSEEVNHTLLIERLFSSIRQGSIPIKNFEIENGKLVVKSRENDVELSKEILIKKSQIRTVSKNGQLQISAINIMKFSKDKSDVAFNSVCQLSQNDDLKCDLTLENFIANSIAELHPNFSFLNKIDATLNATASFAVKFHKLENIFFRAEAKTGSFNFSEFFQKRMDFENFSVSGEYNNNFGVLNLSEIKADFIDDKMSKPHLKMSLLISDLNNSLKKELNFVIKLQNVAINNLEKYWPSALHEHGVRDWVISHVKGGIVKNAYAEFTLVQDAKGSELKKMKSEVNFSGANLEYSTDFPALSNLTGIASFAKDHMKITISSGNVLQSKISDGVVAIDDFFAPVTLLKISGKSVGNAADGLKHADYKSSFATQIGKYLNGNSQNDFDIRIPLHDIITLKHCYIAVNSAIVGLDNEYARGSAIIHTKKDFNNNNFVSNIDLTAAEITAKDFDIAKNVNVAGGLDLIVSLKDPQKIFLKNISLWKKESVVEKKSTFIKEEKLFANILIETSPFLLSWVEIKNNNFGKNNYYLSYKADNKTSTQKILIKAKQLNLVPLLEKKISFNSTENNFSNLKIQVSASNLVMLRNKSLHDFYFSTNCKNNFCYSGVIKSNYGKRQFFNLVAAQKPKEKTIGIDGRITDVGYLAEALGISNVISAGDARVNLRNKIVNKKQVLEGEIIIDNNITVYDSPSLKRLAKNDLYSKIKDKIFSNDKTTFDSVKLEFDITENILHIKSLIANNYKIGITAKGVVDLKHNTYEIKGMIVPGFIINNLFGIGKIPLIGGVISGLLTGGEGGGLFGIHYQYVKKPGDKEATFDTNKVAAFVPSTIQNLFD